MFNKSYSGHYDGYYFRSYAELLFYIKSSKVDKKIIIPEDIVLLTNDNKKIIPDFVIYNSDGTIYEIVEIKTSQDEIDNLIIKYNSSIKSLDYNVKFYNINRKIKKYYEKIIISQLGKNTLEDIEAFKSIRKYEGFSGHKNGMFGKKHSKETIEKIKMKCSNFGNNNGMYGLKHTKKTKKLISENTGWKDEDKKKNMKIKGIMTHIRNMSSEQFDEFKMYVKNVESNMCTKKPIFLNNAYSISITKVEYLFGNFDNFFTFIGECRNDDTN